MEEKERRAEFSQKWMASHAAFQKERDRQYEIYKWTCERSRGERNRELERVGPGDRAGIALAHELHDKQTARAAHIYEGYEKRAWAKHEAEVAALRKEYGITEVPE